MFYCWDNKKVYIGESFYSIMQKFADLNKCGPAEISSHFIGRRKLANLWDDTTVIKKPWLDCEKMSRALHLKEGLLENAFLENFLFEDEINLFTCQNLRFCPICISKGFHSVIHQMFFLKQCPFHSVDLKDTCPHCHQPISMHFNRRDFKKPYSCPQCHYRFFNPSSKEVWVPGNIFYKSFGDIGNFLKHRKACLPKKFNLKLLETNAESRTWFDGLSGIIFKFWEMMYSKNDNSEININRKKFVVYESNNSYVNHDFSDELPIYKSFNKLLEKLIKTYHRKCFEIMKDRDWTAIRSGIVEEIYVCPIVKAYLIWRKFWEGDDKALYHFQPPYSKPKYKYLAIKTYAYSLNQWVGSHLFWQELAGTFLEALQRVSVIEDVGFVNRYPARLSLNQVPYWESYYDQEAQIMRFFHTGRVNLTNCLERVCH